MNINQELRAHVSGKTRCKTCIRCRYVYFKWTSLRQALIEAQSLVEIRKNTEFQCRLFYLVKHCCCVLWNAICFLTSLSFSKNWLKAPPPPRSINTTHSWISYVFLLYSIGLLLLVFRLELVETREERSIKIAYIRSSCASFVCLLTRLLCLEQDARL